MLAKNLLTSNNLDVVPANEYVKQVEPRAKYMSLENSYTRILYPTDEKEEDIEYGYRYTFYEIEGYLYTGYLTNEMSELERLHKNRNIQLSLF